MIDAQSHMSWQPAAGAEPNAEAEAELLGCEDLLDELAGLLRGAVQFDHFVQMHARIPSGGATNCNDGNTGSTRDGSGDTDDSSTVAGGIEGELRRSEGFTKLANAFIALSAQHSWASLAKTLRLYLAEERASADAENAKESKDREGKTREGAWEAMLARSEMIDSSYYVFQRALRRAAHCCDAELAAAALLHCSEVLSNLLIESLQTELRLSLSSKLAGAALAGAQAIAKSTEGSAAGIVAGVALDQALDCTAAARLPTSMLRALNALRLCAVCTPRLWQEARHDMLAAVPAAAHMSLREALAHAQASEAVVQVALNTGLWQLADMVLPQLKPKLERFTNASYVLSNEEGLAAAEGSSFVVPLLLELDQVLGMLQPSLAPANLDALVQVLIGALAEKIEALLLNKQLDIYGAMQLNREVRALLKRFAELTTHSVRDKLARLSQMATLINIEHEREVLEIWSQDGMLLSVTEAKAVMALRVDFRKENIAQAVAEAVAGIEVHTNDREGPAPPVRHAISILGCPSTLQKK